MHGTRLPIVIQGGMGVGVSDWRLARAVAKTGQLGVVSGTALDAILARRLQLGDPSGDIRRALAAFPIPGVAARILDRYFIEGGKAPNAPFKSKPLPSECPSRAAVELLVAGNFVEVFLAKEGHQNQIGINFLEKIQLPTLPSLYGAMLAGVSVVLMGAGIPRAIPGVMDKLAKGEPVELQLDVAGATSDERFVTKFDPADLWGGPSPELPRPLFFAIVASATLAAALARKASGHVDGFVVEGPTAGGHNAPPRGPMNLSREGEPIYTDRDIADLDAIRALGRPFWLAGSYSTPERVAEALRIGAAGVQVGTAFAYCAESGVDVAIKEQVFELSRAGKAKVFTDPVASPTGFPFKVLRMEGTRADPNAPVRTDRVCDLGYLRQGYKKADGSCGWRCPAEPVEDFTKKGGSAEQTAGRVCLCNGLMATVGLGQVRGEDGSEPELPLVTSGDEVATIARFLKPGAKSYAAADVVEYLLQGVATQHA